MQHTLSPHAACAVRAQQQQQQRPAAAAAPACRVGSRCVLAGVTQATSSCTAHAGARRNRGAVARVAWVAGHHY
jgi:hypothetical protein